MEKFKNLEFLRVIGCVAIVLYHLFDHTSLHKFFGDVTLYDKFYYMTKNGTKAVELFFILSGFFFAYKLNLTKSIWDFLKQKLIRLYPVLIFCILLSFVISLTGAFKFVTYDYIMCFLGLTGIGLTKGLDGISVFWYVSAMLWTFILYFYILKNYEKKNVDLFIMLSILFSYSFLIHAKNGVIDHNSQTFYYIFNVGVMRALGGIGIGYFIAEWYKNNCDKIKHLLLSFKMKLMLTGLELTCVVFIINNLMFHHLHYKNQLIFIVVFITTIVLFLIKQGFISQILNKDIWLKLSRYTYSIYMTHAVVLKAFQHAVFKNNSEWVLAHQIENVLLYLIISLLVGVFTYHFIEAPCTRYFSQKLKR